MTWQEKCYDLWGDQWKSVLAKMYLVNRRLVQKWASDYHAIECPQEVQDKINKTHEIWVHE